MILVYYRAISSYVPGLATGRGAADTCCADGFVVATFGVDKKLKY